MCAVLGISATAAATSSRMDILSDDAAASPAESVDVGAMRPIAPPAQPVSKPVRRGNPLWAVPFSALTVTQERPIFSASRRPPPRAVAASPVEAMAAPPPPKPAEAPPPLLLVGVVVGEGDAIAILVNRTDHSVVRLRQGDKLGGWSLTSVQPREVTFKQGERSEILALQKPDGTPAAPAAGRCHAAGCRRQADHADHDRYVLRALRAALHAEERRVRRTLSASGLKCDHDSFAKAIAFHAEDAVWLLQSASVQSLSGAAPARLNWPAFARTMQSARLRELPIRTRI